MYKKSGRRGREFQLKSLSLCPNDNCVITKSLYMMKSRMLLWGALAIAFSLTGCLDSPDNSLFENRYNENFEAMLGGKIDKSQTWVTGSVIQANVRTSGAATINVYTLGKETRILYARQKVNGSGQLRFAIPQNKDAYIAFEADYGDAEKVSCTIYYEAEDEEALNG